MENMMSMNKEGRGRKLLQKKKKGFTLMELIIVIAIIGILAVIAVPKYGNIQKDAKIKADIASAKTMADTATVLITKDEITLPTDATQQDITANVTGALQSMPAPKAVKNAAFNIKVDKDGKVVVYSIVSGGDTIQVYPEVTTVKADKGTENIYYPGKALVQ